MLRPYFVRIKKDLTGTMKIEGEVRPRKSIRFYREAPIPKPKPLLPIFRENVLPQVQISKRSELNAAGKKQFDKILNSQVSNFIFKNFPWDKTKQPRDLWITKTVFMPNVLQTGFESYNSWYKAFKTPDDNRSESQGGTGFWVLAINQLMSGGYWDGKGVAGVLTGNLTELLLKIEAQYDE